MNEREQVLRFAVGTADGARSRTWRLWVPPRKSDLYVSSRRLANSIKVSLHEPGPSRLALTLEHVRSPRALVPPGDDPRGAVEWERPRPRLPDIPMVRPFAILVPWDEVMDRGHSETGDVVWTAPPKKGECIEYDLNYVAAGVTVEGYPGARSMGTKLIGRVELANGEQVFVTSWEHEMDDTTRQSVDRFRRARIIDADGNPITETGILGFGIDQDSVGVLLDVTQASAE